MVNISEEKNPFTRDFGTVTKSYIVRTIQQDDITRSFVDGITDEKAFFIVGQRGFGKSSFLRAAKEDISKNDNWIVIELRSNNDNLIHELAAALYAETILKANFVELELDFSLLGIGVKFNSKSSVTISSDEVAVRKMLQVVKKLGMKVLVVIDEISNSDGLREFCAMFNVCKGDGLPLYLLMDGLYKNTNALENVRDLTFLKRVPKLEVGSLDYIEMFNVYKRLLHMESGENQIFAEKLARMTNGYPYAFQLVGYYTWLWLKEDGATLEDYKAFEERLFAELDRNLNNYVYSTIWGEMAPTEQDILSIMACYNLNKVQDIRNKYMEIFPDRAEMTSGNFGKYRDKLIKSSVLRATANSCLDFALPRFNLYAIAYRNTAIPFGE